MCALKSCRAKVFCTEHNGDLTVTTWRYEKLPRSRANLPFPHFNPQLYLLKSQGTCISGQLPVHPRVLATFFSSIIHQDGLEDINII